MLKVALPVIIDGDTIYREGMRVAALCYGSSYYEEYGGEGCVYNPNSHRQVKRVSNIKTRQELIVLLDAEAVKAGWYLL